MYPPTYNSWYDLRNSAIPSKYRLTEDKDSGVKKMTFEIVKPDDIEKRSMEIITKELNGRTLPEPQFSILKRCIHTSADFDYYDNLVFSEDAARIGIRALRDGADIVTDTKMAAAGINKSKLKQYGGDVHCYISDDDVVNEAKAKGCTRATICMQKGAKLDKPTIFAIGNAPTALVELNQLIRSGKIRPALIIGVPVGFVNVVESKEIIMETDIPYIIARGRKGGSNIAATICNAMLYYKDNV
jgi:precorrin-8X/cobalt-precorrin-8 methylmutase